jgi:isopenicillin N synthase-like dioxygenase
MQIPPELWDQATDNLTKARHDGIAFLSLIRYTTKNVNEEFGINEHRDTAWIPAVLTNEPGLEVKVNEVWTPIPPKDGYLVINFGRKLETLINSSTLVNAVWHRACVKKSRQWKTLPCLFS